MLERVVAKSDSVCPFVRPSHTVQDTETKADSGSAGHGSWVKWVNKCKWVTWVTGQYRKTLDP